MDFIEKMETKILDIQTKCKHIPPQFIIDEYENKSLKYTSILLYKT